MKAKSIKVIVAAVFLACVMVSSSFATDFVSAFVKRSRTTDGSVDLMLRYSSGSPLCVWNNALTGADNIFFTGTPNMDDQALAIALTAISLGKTVRVGIETCPTAASRAGTFSSIALDE